MGTDKILVKEGNFAIISCPSCRKNKKMSVAIYKEQSKRNLKVKCSCDNVFKLCLEYRKHPRKKTKILGKYLNISQENKFKDIFVDNISKGASAFVLLVRSKQTLMTSLW